MKQVLYAQLTALIHSDDQSFSWADLAATVACACLEIGDDLWSRQEGDHGCRAAERGRIVAIDADGIDMEIIESLDCSSCWQTGCTGEIGDGATVGQLVRVSLRHFDLTRDGDLVWIAGLPQP